MKRFSRKILRSHIRAASMLCLFLLLESTNEEVVMLAAVEILDRAPPGAVAAADLVGG